MTKKTDDGKFGKVLKSVEKTVFIISSIIKKLEDSQGADGKVDGEQIVNACLNIANEMKSIPFSLQEIEKILMDIIKSIHKNRSDLEDSVNILIKNTSSQLTKVTEATGEATSNIMDITDKLVEDQNFMTAELSKLKEIISPENKDALDLVDKLTSKVQEDQANTYQIWDFLQFQDITTQQIEYAYNLLRETETKLIKVSDRLGGLDDVQMEVIEEHNTAFDPDANFDFNGNRQSEIDDLINSFNK
jgi:chemotaxis regulatin CheY-phosphate phosphatase CheZ